MATTPDQARIDAALAELEQRTDAEVVVVVAPASGPYRDVDHLAASLAAVLGLTALLFLHLRGRTVGDSWIPPLVALLYLGALFLASKIGPLRRLLTSKARRARQVRDAARTAFVEEGVSRTKGRDAVLIYVSLLEGEAHLVPDLGAEGKVEGARFATLAHELSGARGAALETALLRTIDTLGATLSGAFPKAPGATPELGRRVRVRA